MFWIISAILIFIALAFIWPTLRKQDYEQDATREQNIVIANEQLAELELQFKQAEIDQDSYQSRKDELELSLFNDLSESNANVSEGLNSSGGISTLLILLLIPLIAVPVYLSLGNMNFTKEFDPKMVAKEAARATMPLKADGTPDIEKISQNLEREMESNPTDPQGWHMLGRTYMLSKRFSKAVESFDKSLSLRPDRVDTMLSLAEALSVGNRGRFIGRPRVLINKALTIEPDNATALWFSGMAASQENELVEAIEQWQKLLLHLDSRPEEKEAVVKLIANAKSRISAKEKTLSTGLDNQENSSQNNNTQNNNVNSDKNIAKNEEVQIKATISLANELRDQVSPDDFVFIYAKAMKGPPMPLAAVRKQVKDLPLEVILNDEMAMMPNLKLSSFDLVAVGARVSKTGRPIPQNGDLFTESNGISSGDSISLEINQVYKK